MARHLGTAPFQTFPVIRRLEMAYGKSSTVIKGHSGSVQSVAFSPAEPHVVSGSYDRTIRIWDAPTGKELAVLKGHVGSSDSTIRVWDAQNGNQLSVLAGDHSMVRSVTCSPDLGWTISGDRALMSTEELITDILLTHMEALKWDEKTGWISWKRLKSPAMLLYWLPLDTRGTSFAYHGTTAVIGARQGAVTFLNFAELIAMLRGLNPAPSS